MIHGLVFRAGSLSLGIRSVFAVASCGTISTEQEEVVINCLAIFYEEGKRGENLERRTNFGVKSARARSVCLGKLQEIVW